MGLQEFVRSPLAIAVVTSNADGSYAISGHGGTSASAPISAGIIALAEHCAKRHLGFVNPAIYQIARSSHYHQAVHDATAGNSNTAEFPTGRSPATGHPSTAVAGVDLLNAACGRAGSGSAAQFVLDCPADPRR